MFVAYLGEELPAEFNKLFEVAAIANRQMSS